MASAAFQKAMEKKKNAAKMMQKAKEAENTSANFEVPEIEDGNYIARIKAKVGITPKKGVPYAEFRWTILSNGDGTDSEYVNKSHRQTFFLDGNDNLEMEEKTYEFLGKTLKACTSPDVEFEDADDLEALCERITKEAPHVQITIKNFTGKNGRGITTYFNRRINVTQDAPTQVADAVADAPSDDVISKDDHVIYEGNEYVVVTSSVRSEQCTIKSVDDPNNRYNNIPWGELEVLS